jgi:hypothetical protein
MSNDAVVSALNAQLNDSAGRAFSVITPYTITRHRYIRVREVILTNTSGAVILKGTAVAFNGSKLNGRRATNSDTVQPLQASRWRTLHQGRIQGSGIYQYNLHRF